MRIAAFPAFKSKENPYQVLLYTAMQSVGKVKIEEFNWKNIIRNKYDIVHIHWPESNKLKKHFAIASLYSIAFILLLKISKARGAKLIWTIHNIQTHEKNFPLLERIHFKAFTNMVDGFIAMNKEAVEVAVKAYAVLKDKPHKIIPHGHYKEFYKNEISPSKARQFFDFGEADKVFLVLGNIRPYKGLEKLLHQFRQLNDKSYKLLIAGKVDKEMLHYKSTLERIKADDKRIIFRFEFVKDDDMQYFLNAADVVLLPYKSMLNSGVLLLALSFNKTIAMPVFDNLGSLQKKYHPWIYTYKDLAENDFVNAMEKSKQNLNNVVEMIDENWNKIATDSIQFFKNILGQLYSIGSIL